MPAESPSGSHPVETPTCGIGVAADAETQRQFATQFDIGRCRAITPRSMQRKGLRIVERFSPLDANRLLYRFTMHDPDYAAPYSGELPWPKTASNLYECACHEGGCSMANTLHGARFLKKKRN